MTTSALGERMHEAGFSLLEMLVVLAILALMTTFVVPMLSQGSDFLQLQTVSRELTAALRVTRSAAMLRKSETSLMIYVDRRTFQSTVLARRTFASDIEAKLTFASAVRGDAANGSFNFFPDGSSTGGDITLSLRGRQTKLCVDWLTGEVRQAC